MKTISELQFPTGMWHTLFMFCHSNCIFGELCSLWKNTNLEVELETLRGSYLPPSLFVHERHAQVSTRISKVLLTQLPSSSPSSWQTFI